MSFIPVRYFLLQTFFLNRPFQLNQLRKTLLFTGSKSTESPPEPRSQQSVAEPTALEAASPAAKLQPTFTKHLKEITVMDGDKLTLECHLSCDSEVKVVWLKDNKVIKSSPDFKVKKNCVHNMLLMLFKLHFGLGVHSITLSCSPVHCILSNCESCSKYICIIDFRPPMTLE